MSVVMLMLWKTLWCLLHLTPSCIGGINDVTEIQGTLKIHGRESYSKLIPFVTCEDLKTAHT